MFYEISRKTIIIYEKSQKTNYFVYLAKYIDIGYRLKTVDKLPDIYQNKYFFII